MASYGLLALSTAISAFTYSHIWLNDSAFKQSIPKVVKACGTLVPFTSLREADPVTALRELICVRLSFLRLLYADQAGFGALLVFASVFVPFFLRLSYQAASPNTRSLLQGPILPTLAVLITSADVLLIGSGVALFIPTLIALLYTLGASPSKASALPKLPCPAQAVYGANLTAAFLSAFFIGTLMYDEELTSTEFWWEQFVPEQVLQYTNILTHVNDLFSNVYPVVILPILWLGYHSVKRIHNEEDAKKQLDYYLAAEIAYGFERTWAYYRQAGLLSFLAYLYGVSQIYRGVVATKKIPGPATQYILLVSLLITLASLTIAIVDAQSAPDDGLDEEAKKAIERAPAGNPGVEDNIKVLAVLSLVTGPSMAFMLWYAHQEEIRGWKGRRAWRQNSASKGELAVK
ncbi:uncharacterized protein FA14DRAFT_159733 [Meira miltonrushii]|uniref:Uncharacterized protein n=1 Tax=Meira miltonrushii TaxID=1280837 RepID=A0A316VKX4_9BASI|nr:uncharacterized protein FA14DRAFT_159733 [Meira miltonrushii]PWN37914.1 hypothetical protein FA14DRAFT_159733 [Meira miltonrushii]